MRSLEEDTCLFRVCIIRTTSRSECVQGSQQCKTECQKVRWEERNEGDCGGEPADVGGGAGGTSVWRQLIWRSISNLGNILSPQGKWERCGQEGVFISFLPSDPPVLWGDHLELKVCAVSLTFRMCWGSRPQQLFTRKGCGNAASRLSEQRVQM